MGQRNKLKRFKDLVNFSNVVVLADLPRVQEQIFSAPVVLEVGCGKGGYTLGLARIQREKNFVGIDVKGERLWVGASYAQKESLENVFFVQGPVHQLGTYVKAKSVSEIWITFPDPFPRKKQAKHRLTSPIFLEMYKKILVDGGLVHLKTDDDALFEYTIETVQAGGGKIQKAIANIYTEENLDPVLQIQTDFEKKHLSKGKKIFYLAAQL